jgi:ABC-type cobalamin/Fe3+-siderophores transport system ATPase subunit
MRRDNDVSSDSAGPDSSASSGDARNFSYSLGQLSVGEGALLDLPGPGSVIAIVGPNNVGKSTLLRELDAELKTNAGQSNMPRKKVATNIRFKVTGSFDDMEAWLYANGLIDRIQRYSPQNPRHQLWYNLSQRQTPGFSAHMFANYQAPFDRAQLCNQTNKRNNISEAPSHPFHFLESDHQKRAQFENLAYRLFAQHIEFDFLSGKVGYRVGKLQVAVPPVNAVTAEYFNALATLPLLEEQGDGMRSSLGLILLLITNSYLISLIDEPEAFLHPPQALTLGVEIAKLALQNKSQVIVATHEKNFLQGLAKSGCPLAIIYLTRDGDESRARLLDNDKVAQLWSDTTLRYGNALDGLFHRAVIVTENDRDSQFYAAAVDHVMEGDDDATDHNLMFVAAYGKAGIASIVGRLTDLGVKTISTPDLDILNEEQVLKTLVEAHGGDWERVKEPYRKAVQQFKQPASPPLLSVIKYQINKLIDEAGESNLTRDLTKKIRELVTVPSAWKQLKTAGDRAFVEEKAAMNSMFEILDEMGIVLVRVGELEGFLTTDNAAKGSGFLRVAFEKEAHKGDDARKHALRLLKAAGISPGAPAQTI